MFALSASIPISRLFFIRIKASFSALTILSDVLGVLSACSSKLFELGDSLCLSEFDVSLCVTEDREEAYLFSLLVPH